MEIVGIDSRAPLRMLVEDGEMGMKMSREASAFIGQRGEVEEQNIGEGGRGAEEGSTSLKVQRVSHLPSDYIFTNVHFQCTQDEY